MDQESPTTRWWEYYLPRYLMPSVAGVAIVSWLCSYGGDGLRLLLFLPPEGKPLDSTSLILVFLYGNLFCYVASYPVLVFHATRVMDFSKSRWPAYPFFDGYLITLVLVLAAFFFQFLTPEHRYRAAFGSAIAIAFVQFARIWFVLAKPLHPRGHGAPVSRAYFYSYILAHRRGMPVIEEKIVTKTPSTASGNPQTEDEEEKEEAETTRSRTNLWRKEFMDTYRHLREHGNSALIFLLELVLAALVYCVVTRAGQTPSRELATIALLFGIWAAPSAFVHMLAQHLERRFSRYDQKTSLRSEIEGRARRLSGSGSGQKPPLLMRSWL